MLASECMEPPITENILDEDTNEELVQLVEALSEEGTLQRVRNAVGSRELD